LYKSTDFNKKKPVISGRFIHVSYKTGYIFQQREKVHHQIINPDSYRGKSPNLLWGPIIKLAILSCGHIFKYFPTLMRSFKILDAAGEKHLQRRRIFGNPHAKAGILEPHHQITNPDSYRGKSPN
jgi:hypothetical protein